MTDAPKLPIEARTWLREVERRLQALPGDQRAKILAGLTGHLSELTALGLGGTDAVTMLGSPSSVAEDAFEQYQQQTGTDLRRRYFTVKRVLQIVALVLAIAATLVIALRPTFVQITQTASGVERVEDVTIVEMIGGWSLLILAVPIALSSLPLFMKGRPWQVVSIICIVLLTLFVTVAMPSIGWDFFPTWVVAVIALFFPTNARRPAMEPSTE